MTTTEPQQAAFPQVRGRHKGYEKVAVDAFLGTARTAFETGDDRLSAADVRAISFPMVRHGYEVAPVDAALGRIEDAFAGRERQSAIGTAGAREWVGRSRESAQEILDRVTRPRRRRFSTVGFLRYGYRIEEVDFVADKLARYLETGSGVTVEQVRAAAFKMQRGGYNEAQVDAVLDAVVEVILAVR